jgi:hypothetical protein
MGGASSTQLIEGLPQPTLPGAMPSFRRGAMVVLHIYDLGKGEETQALNRILRVFGSGAFHCGVEVFGKEWSYRGANRVGTGVFNCQPRHCMSHTYCESVPMGETYLSEGEVTALLSWLESEWAALAYSVLRHNCCHFADILCNHLGVGAIPSWVKSLADAAAAVEDKVMGRQSSPLRQVSPPVNTNVMWASPPMPPPVGAWFWTPPSMQEPEPRRALSPPPAQRAGFRVVPPLEVGGYPNYNLGGTIGLQTKVLPPGVGPEPTCWPVHQAFRDGLRM